MGPASSPGPRRHQGPRLYEGISWAYEQRADVTRGEDGPRRRAAGAPGPGPRRAGAAARRRPARQPGAGRAGAGHHPARRQQPDPVDGAAAGRGAGGPLAARLPAHRRRGAGHGLGAADRGGGRGLRRGGAGAARPARLAAAGRGQHDDRRVSAAGLADRAARRSGPDTAVSLLAGNSGGGRRAAARRARRTSASWRGWRCRRGWTATVIGHDRLRGRRGPVPPLGPAPHAADRRRTGRAPR